MSGIRERNETAMAISLGWDMSNIVMENKRATNEEAPDW